MRLLTTQEKLTLPSWPPDGPVRAEDLVPAAVQRGGPVFAVVRPNYGV